MSDSNATAELLAAVGKVLLRCFVLGYVLLLVWVALLLLAPGLIYGVGKPFDLSPHEVNLIHYCLMGFIKSCVLLFFLFPYISIRLVLRNRAR